MTPSAGHVDHDVTRMTRHVALLRGINVGGRGIVSMAALRELFESLGHVEVTTLIQSGNVVFTSPEPVEPGSLDAAIRERFAVNCTVVVVDQDELDRVVSDNPFTGHEPTTVHVGFMAEPPSRSAVAALHTADLAPEQHVAHGRQIYLHLPNGMGRARSPSYLERRLRMPITFRNWSTVTKLAGLARDEHAGSGSSEVAARRGRPRD